VVENEKTRTWAARLVAPLLFFAAAVVLILLVQSGLRADESSSGTNGAPVTTTPTTTDGTTTPTTERRRYRVRRGDTLESIAARFNTDVETLIELNPEIDPLALRPGQRIRVS
jgi:LysM repeat protein